MYRVNEIKALIKHLYTCFPSTFLDGCFKILSLKLVMFRRAGGYRADGRQALGIFRGLPFQVNFLKNMSILSLDVFLVLNKVGI